MAALDFPNSPINGATYNAPNGAVYTYDGSAWTVSGVLSTGTAAGGSLAGTYPNPTIAAQAVRGTPSSGGTAREIQKASIWAGDDLINLSVPAGKLGVQAATVTSSAVAIPTSFSSGTLNAWVKIVDLPAMTTRGGLVQITAWSGGWIAITSPGGNLYLGLYRNGTILLQVVNILSTGTLRVPIPTVAYWNVSPVGSTTYSLYVFQGTNTLLQTGPDSTGSMSAVEFS